MKIPSHEQAQMNAHSARFGRQTLEAFSRVTLAAKEDALSDLLCDLMHFSALGHSDFCKELARAKRNFNEETQNDGN